MPTRVGSTYTALVLWIFRGFGFITFKNKESVGSALGAQSGSHVIDEKKVSVVCVK